jgi:hypothetical protein
MSEKSKMPSGWALADSAVRPSVVCLVNIWYKVKVENTLFRLGKNLVKFPNEDQDDFSTTTEVPIGQAGYQGISKDTHSHPPSFQPSTGYPDSSPFKSYSGKTLKNVLEMSEGSKVPSDWVPADPAIRLSVVRLVRIWYKVKLEIPLIRLRITW